MPDMPTLRTISADQLPASCFEPVDPQARAQAGAMIDDVKEKKEDGLLEHAWRLGDLPSGDRKYAVTRAELRAAFDAAEPSLQGLLERVAARVRKFAEAQRASITTVSTDIEGGTAGQQVVPVSSAGCYAPGGRYPLPSSVIMTAVTARAAGVERVVVASPRPSPVTLAAAYVAGADLLLAVGGAHAVAALAYGLGDALAPVDLICGPGNKWVTAAKSIVSGFCGIDMLAGPSEVLVIADASADPEVVAADLLAQAEHDVEARPILVTPDAAVIAAVNRALQSQLATLTTSAVAIPAVQKGFAVLVGDVAEAVRVSDRIAPEHLEIQTADAQRVGESCANYGGLFIGAHAAEVLGDYGAGPNHVLPTAGTGKYTGGLSVHTFLRQRTWMRIDDLAAAQRQVEDSVALARLEGLEGHARAAERRLLADAREGKKQRAA
uniref:Histidinol dehydrogenase n=1 Tax=Calcidiscus leptoporus TaxID=127549 RepID=A0A7S0J8G3_9EUKA